MKLTKHHDQARGDRRWVKTDAGLVIGSALIFDGGTVRLFHRVIMDNVEQSMATEFASIEDMRHAIDGSARAELLATMIEAVEIMQICRDSLTTWGKDDSVPATRMDEQLAKMRAAIASEQAA